MLSDVYDALREFGMMHHIRLGPNNTLVGCPERHSNEGVIHIQRRKHTAPHRLHYDSDPTS